MGCRRETRAGGIKCAADWLSDTVGRGRRLEGESRVAWVGAASVQRRRVVVDGVVECMRKPTVKVKEQRSTYYDPRQLRQGKRKRCRRDKRDKTRPILSSSIPSLRSMKKPHSALHGTERSQNTFHQMQPRPSACTKAL